MTLHMTYDLKHDQLNTGEQWSNCRDCIFWRYTCGCV